MFASRVSAALRLAARVATGRPSPQLSSVHAPHRGAPGVLVGRGFAQVTFTFVDGEGESTRVAAEEGQTLLDVAHENDLELEGACDGEMLCSMCHLVFEKRIYKGPPEICEDEEDMLNLAAGVTHTSRLGCQITVTKKMKGMTVRIPDEAYNQM
ncbi:hypothetical protein PR003_g5191 [Phytophthora rubi]|uniref:2Fe-2S ferredoxin-type domain-containing protein n=1 Tax=Phytophthora rubi TaxID=129364 RepID=A0A6A3MMI3_9STRA|nr:hypothetical protein PR002_g10854 [Phytophthora rubi]KAE9032646.1 hypothetical protein PR001_g10517 [Phytophthora rubi]KAE9350801.1 hypothetical protein PR003_g5191 [Phytophthora rubi]